LGNYFGMMAKVLELRRTHEVFCFLADYHALTGERDPQRIRDYTLDLAAAFLALGFASSSDPLPAYLYRQSAVPEVHELAWYLSCVTNVGTLLRAHAYKDAEAKGLPVNLGTFNYPTLMSADILLYGSDVVPVGQDQHQHVQIAQEQATHLNAQYKDLGLKIPEALFGRSPIVPGTDGTKMSKSKGNVIPLFAPPRILKERVMSIKTDSTPLDQPKNPSTCPVMQLYRLVGEPQAVAEMERKYLEGGYGYGHAKQALFEGLEDRFGSSRERYTAYRRDVGTLESYLSAGAEGAREVALKTLKRVRQAVGMPTGDGETR
jgi:tryptophanyl-tRNA synthetase